MSSPPPRGSGSSASLPSDRFQAATPADPSQALRALASASPNRLDSVELKMQLAPDRFIDLNTGLDDFWGRVISAAQACNLSVARGTDVLMRNREVSFLDTRDFALHSAGFILRRRSRSEGDEYTLKFRDTDRAKAAASNPNARPDLEPKNKFEKDVTCQSGRELFSRSSKVKVDNQAERKPSVGSLGEMFPGLKKLGLSADTHLPRVQGRRIREDVHTLGELRVTKEVSVPVHVTLWYEDRDPDTLSARPVIAELSFRLADDDMVAEPAARRLVGAVIKQNGDWLGDGTTKVEWVYSDKGLDAQPPQQA